MILYRRKRYNLFTRWIAAVQAASVITWTVMPGVVLAQPVPVSPLNTPFYAPGGLDPIFRVASNSATAQTWEYVIAQGKFTLAAQWEAAVNAGIDGHLGGVSQSDQFNSVQEYRDYLRKELLLQKQQAFADWELALDAEIAGARSEFLSDLSERRLRAAQENSDDAIDDGRVLASNLDNTAADLESDRDAWDDEFQQGMQAGFSEYQLALGALQQEYTSLLNELALKDAEFQDSLQQIDAYEQRVRDGIQSTVTNLESLLANNGFFYQETCGGPHGTNCSTDMSQLNAAGLELQTLLTSIRQDLANDAPLSAIAVQMTDYMQRRQVEAAARMNYWTGLVSGTTSYDQFIDSGYRFPSRALMPSLSSCPTAVDVTPNVVGAHGSVQRSDHVRVDYSCDDYFYFANIHAALLSNGAYRAATSYIDSGSVSDIRAFFSEARDIQGIGTIDVMSADNPVASPSALNPFLVDRFDYPVSGYNRAPEVTGWDATEQLASFHRSYSTFGSDALYKIWEATTTVRAETIGARGVVQASWTGKLTRREFVPNVWYRVVINYNWKDLNAEANASIWSGYNNALNGMLTRWRDELLPAIQNWEAQVATYKADYAAWQAEADVQRATAAAAFQGGQADLIQSRNRWLARMEEEYRSGRGDWAAITKKFEAERDGIAAAAVEAAPKLSAEFLNRGRGNRPDLNNLAKFEQGIQSSLQGSLNFAVADTLNSQALDIRQKQFEAISSVLNPYSDEDLAPFSAEDQARLDYLKGLAKNSEALDKAYAEELEALQTKKGRKEAAARYHFDIQDQGGQIVANRLIADGSMRQIGGDGSSVNDYAANLYNQSVVVAAPAAVQLVSTPDLFDVWDTGEVVGSFYDTLKVDQQKFKEQLDGVQQNVAEANSIAQSGWERYFENAEKAAERVTLMKKLMKSAILGMLGGVDFHSAFAGALEGHVRGQFASQLEAMTGIPATFLSALLGGADIGEALGAWAESVFWENVQTTFNLPDEVTQLLSSWVSSEIAKAEYRQRRREAARFQPEDMLGGVLTYAWRNQQYQSDLNKAMVVGETAAGILLNSVGNIIPGAGTAIWTAYNTMKQSYLGSLNGGTQGAVVGIASGALNSVTSQYGVNVNLSYSFENGYGGSVGVGVPLGEGGPQLGLNMNFQEGQGITSYGAGLAGDTWNAGLAVGADGDVSGTLSFGGENAGFGLSMSDANGIGAALTSEYGNLVYSSDSGFSYSTPDISFDVGGFTGDFSYNTADGWELDGEGYGFDSGYDEGGLTIGAGGDAWEAGYNLTTGEFTGGLQTEYGNFSYDPVNGFGYDTGDVSYDIGGITGNFSYSTDGGLSFDGSGYGMEFAQDENGLSFGGDWSAGDLDFGYDSENGFTAALHGAGDDLLAYNEQDGLTSPYIDGVQSDLTEQFEAIANLNDIESQIAAVEDLVSNPGDYVDLNPFGEDPFSDAPDLDEMFPGVFASSNNDGSNGDEDSGDIAAIIESITGERDGEIPPPEEEPSSGDSTNTAATDNDNAEPIASAPPPAGNSDSNRPKPIAAAPAASTKPKPAKLFSQSLTRDINAGVVSGIPKQPPQSEVYWHRKIDSNGQVYFLAKHDDGRTHKLTYTDEGILRQDIWHSDGTYAGAKSWDANGNNITYGYYKIGGGAPKTLSPMQIGAINSQSTYTDPAGKVWKKSGDSFVRYVDGQRQTLTFQFPGIVKQQIFRKEYRKVKSARNGNIVTQLVEVPLTKFWDADGKELGVWARQLNAKEQAQFDKYWGIKKEEETIMQTEVDTDDLAAIEEYRDRAAAVLGLKREEYQADIRGPRRDRVRYCTADRSVCYGMQPENSRTFENLIDRWKETNDFQAYLREPLATKAIDRGLLYDLRKGLENAIDQVKEYSLETAASFDGALRAIGKALSGGGMDAINEFAVSDLGTAFIDNLALGVLPVVGDVQTFFEATKQIYAGEHLEAALTIGTGVVSTFARPLKALFRIGADKVTKAKKALKRGEIDAPRKKPDEYSKAEQDKAVEAERAKREAQDQDGNGKPNCKLCFAAGTEVLTPDGYKSIDALKVGDVVFAVDPAGGRMMPRDVTETFRLPADRWLDVDTGEDVLTVAADHPFWVENRNDWLRADELTVGMSLRTAGGNLAAVESVSEPRLAGDDEFKYNLTVAGEHTFFAGRDGVLVHNVDPTDDCEPGNVDPSDFSRIDLRHFVHNVDEYLDVIKNAPDGGNKFFYEGLSPYDDLGFVITKRPAGVSQLQEEFKAYKELERIRKLGYDIKTPAVDPRGVVRVQCRNKEGQKILDICGGLILEKVGDADYDLTTGSFKKLIEDGMPVSAQVRLAHQIAELHRMIQHPSMDLRGLGIGISDLQGRVDIKTGEFYIIDPLAVNKNPKSLADSKSALNMALKEIRALLPPEELEKLREQYRAWRIF